MHCRLGVAAPHRAEQLPIRPKTPQLKPGGEISGLEAKPATQCAQACRPNAVGETHVPHIPDIFVVLTGIPFNLVQKWLGHAQLSTTAIYADAVGAEEHQIMEKMYGS